jgi:rod shape determining protein RodA
MPRKFHLDSTLLLVLVCLFIISLLGVYSGSGQYQVQDPYFYVKRQAIWYLLGFAVMAGVANFDFELLERWAWPLYLSGIGLLVVVHFFGTYRNGSQRWINLRFFELQPSEFMKLFLIVLLAGVLIKQEKHKLSLFESIPVTFKLAVITFIPFFLILMQPDLGSALVIASIAFAMIVVSGISYKMIMALCISFAALIAFLVYLHHHYFETFIKIIKPHQLDRIYGWLSPHEYASSYGYQLTQAMMGIGSGQITGWGFNKGRQVQSGKIPEAHTDFIFSVIGEEFGFIGTSILISLYFILIYRIMVIALGSYNLLGVYICTGVIGLFAFQVFQNIAMTIGLMPVTGLTLPLVSYGGSALLTNMMALGLVLSVHIRSQRFTFSRST